MRVAIYMVALWALGWSDSVQAADRERIRATIEALATNGARMAGYAGDSLAAAYIERALSDAGVESLTREAFEVVVPVDHGAVLELAAEQLPLVALWPNLVRTPTTPPEGIAGSLFYGGRGEYSDLDGYQVEGGIALLEFNTWNNWQNAAALKMPPISGG